MWRSRRTRSCALEIAAEIETTALFAAETVQGGAAGTVRPVAVRARSHVIVGARVHLLARLSARDGCVRDWPLVHALRRTDDRVRGLSRIAFLGMQGCGIRLQRLASIRISVLGIEVQ